MASERFEGWSDRRSDVYALGVTLYEMATLNPAFPARDRAQLIHQILHEDPAHPRRLDRRVPRDLETIIRKAMAREPAERYRSADELAEDLENFLAHRPIRARRNTLTERAWKWCRRKPALAGLWLVLALGLAGTSWQWWRAERSLGRTNRMAMGLALDRALALCQQGEPARGMLQMVDLLRTAWSSAPEYEHTIRANLTAWAQKLPRPVAMRRLSAPPANLSTTLGYMQKQLLTVRKKTALVNTFHGVEVWDLERFEPTGVVLADGQDTVSLALLFDEKSAVTIDGGGAMQRWDVATGSPLGPSFTCRDDDPSSPIRRPLLGSLLSPSGTIAATFTDLRAFRLWDLKASSPIGGPITLRRRLGEAAFSPDGKFIAAFGGGTTGERWETATCRSLAAPSLVAGTRGIAFSPDGRVLAMRSDGGGISSVVGLCEADTGRVIGLPLAHGTRVSSVCFSQDGRTVASLDVDGSNRFCDAGTGEPIGEPFWQRTEGNFYEPRFGGDNKSYLTIERHADKKYYLLEWKIPTDRPANPLSEPTLVHELFDRTLAPQPFWARSPNGTLAANVYNNGTVVVREAASLRPVGPVVRHRRAVLAVAICPDGQTLATGSADATAQVWDFRSGRSIGSSLTHRGPVRSVAFRGDGKVMATGSDDGTARLWDSTSGRGIGLPLPHSALRSEALTSTRPPASIRAVPTSPSPMALSSFSRTRSIRGSSTPEGP